MHHRSTLVSNPLSPNCVDLIITQLWCDSVIVYYRLVFELVVINLLNVTILEAWISMYYSFTVCILYEFVYIVDFMFEIFACQIYTLKAGCQRWVLYPLRSVTFAWTSVISVNLYDCRFKAEEVWFKWFWLIQSSSSDQFLTQLLKGIYLILVFWIDLPNLFACYSSIYLDYSIVLSISLELNWSVLGLCYDMTVCKHRNNIIC